MASAFSNSVCLNLNLYAREFVEGQRKKNSDQLTHSIQNQIDLCAPHPFPLATVGPSIPITALSTVLDVSSSWPSVYNALGSLAKNAPEDLLMGVVHLSIGVFSLLNLCRALLHLCDLSRLPPYVALNAEKEDTCNLTAPNISALIAENGLPDTIKKNV